MGRPPIHDTAMSKAELQRRWRANRRLRQTAEPPRERDQQPEPDSPRAPSTVPEPAPPDHQLVKQLTHERDQAWKERNDARHQLDLVVEQRDAALKGIMPPPEVVGDHIQMCWCSFCAKPRDRVKTMIVGSIRQRLFICSECVERCNEIISQGRSRGAQSRTDRMRQLT